ncbi:hypothetical protein ABIF69_005924 [Bradyrhizobium japonicum]
MELLAQVDPPAFQKAMSILARTHTIVQAQQQAAQQQASIERQQIETWAKNEGARYDTWAAKEGIKASEIAPAAEEYLGGLGIDRESLARLTNDNPILRSAEFQRMLTDAARFQMIKAAPAKAMPRPVPSVQRPGVARTAGDRDMSEIVALRQKAAATGDAEDVFKLYKAKKARR